MSISSNGNGFSNNGNNVSNNGFAGKGYERSLGDIMGDLRAQDIASQDRRVQPADPAEFLRWVRQTLRDQRMVMDQLAEEHASLSKAGDLATVGLKRLGALVKFNDRLQYEYLVDLHRDFTFKNQNIGYTLEKCRGVLNETTINAQFVGETLNAALADRHKKIAVQKELGLRLRDTDSDFDRCKRAVGGQKTTYKQLSEGIQTLMSKASIKLPAKVKATMNMQDEVAKLAIMHQKSLSKGKDAINSKKYIPSDKTNKITFGGWGDTSQDDSSTEAKDVSKTPGEVPEVPEESTEKFDPKIALASTTVGLIVGILVFYVLLSR
jgi:hypothetical protein